MLHECREAIWNILNEYVGEEEGEVRAVTITVVTTDAEGKIMLVHMGYPEEGDFSEPIESPDSTESPESTEQIPLGI